ncbi:MAG TPA: YIP1 family protein [Rhodocyclaceae bacterium]|nr:YIP1 family protein [Rhodocyclaceae bacterium]
MSPASFPRMLVSEREGWSDISRTHPSVRKLFRSLVVPMSLIPPLMYAFAQLAYPGRIFALSRPEPSAASLLVNGVVFFAVELAMVAFMAMVIRQIADGQDYRVPHENAYALAAIAPVPLWLAALALFIPSLGANMVILVLAWIGSVALIRHGVRPLLGIEDDKKARYVANMITLSGVIAWFSLLIVAAGILSFLLVWWR